MLIWSCSSTHKRTLEWDNNVHTIIMKLLKCCTAHFVFAWYFDGLPVRDGVPLQGSDIGCVLNVSAGLGCKSAASKTIFNIHMMLSIYPYGIGFQSELGQMQ